MPLTFEELADSKIDENLLNEKSSPKSSGKLILFFIVLLLISASIVIYQQFIKVEEDPIAAQILLSEELTEEAVLLHIKDSSTEFQPSLKFLKKNATAPDYRETEATKTTKPPVIAANSEINTAPVQLEQKQEVQLEQPLKAEKTPTIVQNEQSPSNTDTPVALPTKATIDWGGLVLVPKSHVLAKAYNSDVELLRVEAHPIEGDRIRVWTRIRNRTANVLKTEVACEFRSETQYGRPHFTPVVIQPNGVIDTYFVSQIPLIHSYTIMVKR
jgi:hypothetical protein